MTRPEALALIRAGLESLEAIEVPAIPEMPAEPPPPVFVPTVIITERDQLWNTVKAAKSGDVIALATGVYSDLKLQKFRFDGTVTITSLDKTKPALLTDINVQDCAGLVFTDLELLVEPERGSEPFKFTRCERLTLTALSVHGSLDGDSSNDTSGMNIRSSSDVLMMNCRFVQLANGVTQLDNSRIRFAENIFFQIRMDAIRGGGSSDLLIEDNWFSDFQPLKADHGDAVQVWTTNTSKSAERITIRRNVVVQGQGGAVQGIFVTMQTSHRYQVVEITDNLIIGGLTNAITVAGADGVTIERNVVAAVGAKTWIRMANLTGLSLNDNQATSYTKIGMVEITAEANNTKLPAVADGGSALLAARRA